MKQLHRIFGDFEFELVEVMLLRASPGADPHPRHTDFLPKASSGGKYWRSGRGSSSFLGLYYNLFVYLSNDCKTKSYGSLVLPLKNGCVHEHTPSGEGSWCILDAGYPHGTLKNTTGSDRHVLCLSFLKKGVDPFIRNQILPH